MEKYEKPEMEVIDLENDVILTSTRCGSGDPYDNETSMANIW